MVTNPKNIIIAENCFCNGYVRGNGVRFFTMPRMDSAVKPVGFMESNNGRDHSADIISVVVPYGFADDLPNPMDIEAHERFDFSAPPTKIQQTQPGMLKKAAFMDADWISTIFQLHEFSRQRQDPMGDKFITYERQQNTIVFRGHQFSYDVNTGSHSAVTVNTGHWGPS